MQVLLTADGGITDLVYVDESMINWMGGRIRQIVIDPQSLDDGVALLLLVGKDLDSRDSLDLLLERKSSDCHCSNGSGGGNQRDGRSPSNTSEKDISCRVSRLLTDSVESEDLVGTLDITC